MPVFVRYLHFMILHRLFCLVFDVMFVSMTDEMGGYIRPPDESGGYRMTDVMEVSYTLMSHVASSFRGY